MLYSKDFSYITFERFLQKYFLDSGVPVFQPAYLQQNTVEEFLYFHDGRILKFFIPICKAITLVKLQ